MKPSLKTVLTIHAIFTICLSVIILAAIVLYGQYYVATSLRPLLIILVLDLIFIVIEFSIRLFKKWRTS